MKRLRVRIKRADLIAIMLSKPDRSLRVNSDTPGSSTGRWDSPLCNRRTDRIIQTDGIGDRHGEPDFAGLINSDKERLTVACRECNNGSPVLCIGIKQSELARRSRTGTTRCQITARQSDPDTSTAVKCGSPGIAPKNRIIGNATDAR